LRLPSLRRLSCRHCRRQRISARQRFDDLPRGSWTLRRIARKTAQDDPFHRRIEVADDARWCRDLARRIAQAFRQCPRGVRGLAGEELVHHQAEGVQIALHGGLRAL
jgi:hypothetical protein